MTARLARALIAAGVAAVVHVAAEAAAPALPGMSVVRRHLEQALGESLGGPVRIGGLEARLDGSVTVTDVALQPEKGSVRSLQIESATVRIAIGQLLRGRLRVLALRGEGVSLTLRPTGGPTPEKREPLDARILGDLEELHVARGALRFERPDGSLLFAVDSIAVDGTPQPGGVGGDLTAGPLTIAAAGEKAPRVDSLRVRWSWRAPRLQYEVAALETSAGRAGGDGVISFGKTGVVARGRAGAVVELAGLAPLAGIPLDGRLRVDADFRASPGGAIEVAGIVASDGRIQVADAQLDAVAGRVDWRPSGLEVSGVTASLPAGSRVAVLDLALRPDGALEAKAGGELNLPEFFGLVGARRETSVLHGRARFEAQASRMAGTGQPLRWVVDADVEANRAETGAITGVLQVRGEGGAAEVAFDGFLDDGPATFALEWGPGPFADRWTAQAQLTALTGASATKVRNDALRLLENFDIELPAGTIPFPAGPAVLDLVLDGRRPRGLAGDISFVFEQPAYGPNPMAYLEGRVRLEPGDAWRVDVRLSDAEGDGVLAALGGQAGGAVAVDAAALRAPLPVIRDYVIGAFGVEPPVVEGEIDAAVRGLYLWDGARMHLSAHARGAPPGWPAADVALSGDMVGDEISVSSARLATRGLSSRFEGQIVTPMFRPFSIAGGVTADADWSEFFRGAPDVHAAGRLALAGWASLGEPDAPIIVDADVAWAGFEWAGLPAPDGAAVVRPLRDGFEATLTSERWSARASVTGPLAAPRIEAALQWRQLDFVDVVAAINKKPLGVNLSLDSAGSLDFAGPLLAPAQWRGAAALTRLDVGGAGFESHLGRPALFTLDGGWLSTTPGQPLTLLGKGDVELQVAGRAGWFGEASGALDLRVEGAADLSLLEILDPDLVAGGQISLAVDVGGRVDAPQIAGWCKVRNGGLRLLTFNEAIDRLDAEMTLRPGQIGLTRATCALGGGEVQMFGTLSFDGWAPDRFDVSLRARDVALTLPEGMWGRYDADLRFVGPATEPELQGEMALLAGRYTAPMSLDIAAGVRSRKVAPATSRAHWTSRIGLRLRLSGEDSLAVRNDMAQLQAGAQLEITGDVARPLVSGAVVLLEGGRFTFRGVDYEVATGQLIFDDPHGAEARLRLRATTEIGGYQIRLDLDASGDDVDYQLSSTPARSPNDILAMLLTGQSPDEFGGAQSMAGDLPANYFGTALGEFLLANPARNLLGVTRFNISPTVVGPENNPAARVTVGQRLDDKTMLIYSRDLSAEGDDLYRVERQLNRELRALASSQQDAGVALDLRWLHRFGDVGGNGPSGVSATSRLASHDIIGWPDELKLRWRKDLGLAVGRPAPHFQVIQAREALRRKLVEAGRLEASVTSRVELESPAESVSRASVIFEVQPGPEWTLTFVGPDKSVRSARRALVDLWAGVSFNPGRLREAASVVREVLADEGYAVAIVEVRRPDPERREVVVTVDPGPRVTVDKVAFEGLGAVREKEALEQVLLRPSFGLTGSSTIYRPRVAAEDAAAIETLYAERGYLSATVEPRVGYRGDGASAVLTFVVVEGPRSQVGVVRVEGDWPEELGPATNRIPLKTGGPFSSSALDSAEAVLRQALDEQGWFESRVVARPEVVGAVVDVTFRVWAGRRATVADVRFEGLTETRRKIADSAVRVKPGAPLSAQQLRETESDLLRLGRFRKVEIRTEQTPDDASRRVVVIRVEETPSVSLTLSAGYDTEERFRGSASLADDNLWGLARTGALQVYASALRYGVRTTLEDRHLRKDSLEGLLALGFEHEEKEGYTIETTGLTIQIGEPLLDPRSLARQPRRWQARYTIEDDSFSDVTIDPEAIEDALQEDGRRLEDVRLGGLIGNVIRDERNDPFLPVRGWLAQAELGVWSEWLASERDFTRVIGQVAGYRSRGRTTLAGAMRLGLAWPYGDTDAVALSKRFFAGGSSSMRGFELDGVGPKDDDGDPLGGEALFVTNIETRFRVWGEIHAMLFYDIGNVWLQASDLFEDDLRNGAGVGLRIATPVGALRVEYGWNLDRRPGESPGEFYFSIGEPF